MTRFIRPLGFALVLAALLGLGGCTAPSDKPKHPVQIEADPPRGYHPLEVHNACFVESVHFCDFYNARRLGGADGWVRVMDWGDRKKETIKGGHAVAVYTLKGKLWAYDINHGFLSLSPPVERRLDLNLVAPQILARYPEMNSVLARYLDEQPQTPDKPQADYTKGITTMELDDALHVAATLGKFRPVRVVEFIAPRDSYLRPYAATVFRYGNKLCLYSAWNGTRVVDAPLAGRIDDLEFVRSLVLSAFPDAQHIKWFQPAKTVVVQ